MHGVITVHCAALPLLPRPNRHRHKLRPRPGATVRRQEIRYPFMPSAPGKALAAAPCDGVANAHARISARTHHDTLASLALLVFLFTLDSVDRPLLWPGFKAPPLRRWQETCDVRGGDGLLIRKRNASVAARHAVEFDAVREVCAVR